ncbi:MAG TPA: hypothetical protein VGC42_11075 [Kofleriaceae bacterium]
MSAAPATSASKLADNPFYVLGVAVEASRIEVEREAQKLLGMLELGFAQVATYLTPLGPRPRTPELVRAAVAALRDPYQRLVAELWARHAPPPTGSPAVGARIPDAAESSSSPSSSSYPSRAGLRRRLGWRP